MQYVVWFDVAGPTPWWAGGPVDITRAYLGDTWHG